MATIALMKTADFLPKFLSSLGDLTDSMSNAIVRVVDARSWRGRRRAKSSIAVSTTDVAGGGGSNSAYSASECFAWHSDRVSCSHAPSMGLRSYIRRLLQA